MSIHVVCISLYRFTTRSLVGILLMMERICLDSLSLLVCAITILNTVWTNLTECVREIRQIERNRTDESRNKMNEISTGITTNNTYTNTSKKDAYDGLHALLSHKLNWTEFTRFIVMYSGFVLFYFIFISRLNIHVAVVNHISIDEIQRELCSVLARC